MAMWVKCQTREFKCDKPRIESCRDCWIERYLVFIELLNQKLGRGPVSTHCVTVAARAYGAFRESCDPFYRRSCWRAISAACQLFSQTKGRN